MLTPAAETVAAWVVILCVVAWMVSNRIAAALCWLDRRNAELDVQTAADHAAHDEWANILAAVGLTEDQVRAGYEEALIDQGWYEIEFAASVLDDIDHLDGGGDAA